MGREAHLHPGLRCYTGSIGYDPSTATKKAGASSDFDIGGITLGVTPAQVK